MQARIHVLPRRAIPASTVPAGRGGGSGGWGRDWRRDTQSGGTPCRGEHHQCPTLDGVDLAVGANARTAGSGAALGADHGGECRSERGYGERTDAVTSESGIEGIGGARRAIGAQRRRDGVRHRAWTGPWVATPYSRGRGASGRRATLFIPDDGNRSAAAGCVASSG